MRDVRDERDGPNGEGLDSLLRTSNDHRSTIFSLEGGLDGFPLRVSNEGLRRPRVARAQKIIRLHPILCSASKKGTWPLLPRSSRLRRSPVGSRLREKSGASHHPFVTSNGPSKLARYFSPMDCHPCWSHCGRRTSTFRSGAFREHRTNMGAGPRSSEARHDSCESVRPRESPLAQQRAESPQSYGIEVSNG